MDEIAEETRSGWEFQFANSNPNPKLVMKGTKVKGKYFQKEMEIPRMIEMDFHGSASKLFRRMMCRINGSDMLSEPVRRWSRREEQK